MRNSIIIFVCLLPFLLMAQEKSSFDVVAGASFSHRILKSVDSSPWPMFDFGANDDVAVGLGWRIGFNYNKRLSESIFFKTGLRVSSTQFKRAYSLNWHADTADPDYVSSDVNYHTFYHFSFIEIPLALRYEYGGVKLDPFVELGISPHFFVGSSVNTIVESTNATTASEVDNNFINYVLVLSAGFNYKINKKNTFFCQPSFRYNFSNLTIAVNSSAIGETINLYNFGIEFGLRKNIN